MISSQPFRAGPAIFSQAFRTGPQPRSVRSRTRAERSGFTMVEVMMGLAVLAVGAAAVIALLKFTVLGTLDSRHLSNASLVAGARIDRIQTAALEWDAFDNQDLTDMNGAGAPDSPAPFLGAFVDSVATGLAEGTPSTWAHFGAANGAPSPNFGAMATIDGDDTTNAANAAYCTHIRVTWVSAPDKPAPGTQAGDSFRVEVRTFWARSGRSIGADCAVTPATFDPLFGDPNNVVAIAGANRTRAEYGVIYMTTIVRRNGV